MKQLDQEGSIGVCRRSSHNLIQRIEIKDEQLVSVVLKQPFHGLFWLASSNKGSWSGGRDTI